jgi:hypothetical protein
VIVTVIEEKDRHRGGGWKERFPDHNRNIII